MGKGQIISGGTGGEYQVKVLYNRDRYDAMIAALNAKKTKLEENRVPIQSERDDKSAEVDAVIVELNLLIGELTDLYTDLEALQSELSSLRDQLAVLEQELQDLLDEPVPDPVAIAAKRQEIADKKVEISDKQTEISDKQKEIEEKQAEAEEKQKEANSLSFELAILGQQLAEIDLQITSIEKKIQYLEENMPADETVSAWCADLTEDLTGNVGTVEIPGERIGDHGILQIQPGYDSNAVYDQDRDGQIFPTIAMTAAQAFYNAAMLPGWQKWKPLFRHGTITAIEDSLASVTLDATVKSSQQGLDINQAATLTGVEFEYMSCDGSAFAVDDEVLIMFTDQDFANPKIIGFKTDPVGCCEYVENWTDGTFDQTWYEYNESLGSIETADDEYYYHVAAPSSFWYMRETCSSYPTDHCWTHNNLTFGVNITNVSLSDSINGYVATKIEGLIDDEGDRAQLWFFHGRTENFPPGLLYLNEQGWGTVLYGLGEGEVEVDLSEEPYNTILGGGISDISLRVYLATADINYFRLCGNSGADPMQEPE